MFTGTLDRLPQMRASTDTPSDNAHDNHGDQAIKAEMKKKNEKKTQDTKKKKTKKKKEEEEEEEEKYIKTKLSRLGRSVFEPTFQEMSKFVKKIKFILLYLLMTHKI